MRNSEVKTLEIKHLIEKISISINPIEIGNIHLSSLSKEHIKRFPIAIAFDRAKHFQFVISTSSNVNWCSVPDKIDVDEKTDFLNLPLSIDLGLLHIAGLGMRNMEFQHHEIILEICISEKEKTENKKCISVVIPVNVNWISDIPFVDNPGRPKVDKTEIIFDPLNLTSSSDKSQDKEIHITNIGNSKITCDLNCPNWIKSDPSCLVLEPGQTKASSIQIDPTCLKIGLNTGQIAITNSDIKINVSIDVTANGPVPYFENDISISIPYEKTNEDYIHTLIITNVGKGELHVTLPINMNDRETKTKYSITDKLEIPITIPKSNLCSNQDETFNFNIETNSVIEGLRNILTHLQYTIEPAQEVKPMENQEAQAEQKNAEKIMPPMIENKTKKEKRNYVMALLASVFLINILLALILSLSWNNNAVSVKPKLGSGNKITQVNNKRKSNDGLAQKNQQSPITLNGNYPQILTQTFPETQASDVISDEIQDNSIQKTTENIEEESIEMPDKATITKSDKDDSFIKISIYTLPRAYIYIDKQKLPDATPLENIQIRAGSHIIHIVACDDPSKNITIERVFKDGDYISLDATQGNW